ncbi:uncharacterized protein LOC110826493 [Zootermopsis nevadensis]|uniref:uncharacterized protein LOC110826493 n=1 Tax=Zootermopsis nevadensis TaxID=136037 RepID=UPI000B8EA358|nr:uncharacterized protein LOC110826493 [Zootermopsis nevadensis]
MSTVDAEDKFNYTIRVPKMAPVFSQCSVQTCGYYVGEFKKLKGKSRPRWDLSALRGRSTCRLNVCEDSFCVFQHVIYRPVPKRLTVRKYVLQRGSELTHFECLLGCILVIDRRFRGR